MTPEDYRRQLGGLGPMDFPGYFLSVLAEKGLPRSQAVANSGLEVHYAYQILNGTRSPRRDKLLCLCIGGGLSLAQTQRALARAEAGCLYPKRVRDALIMVALNRGLCPVWRVNELLARHHQSLLA